MKWELERKHVEEEGGRERKKESQKRAPRPQTRPRWLGVTHTHVPYTHHMYIHTYIYVYTLRCCLFFFPSAVCRLYTQHTHTDRIEMMMSAAAAHTENLQSFDDVDELFAVMTHTNTHTHTHTHTHTIPLLLYRLSLTSFRQIISFCSG